MKRRRESRVPQEPLPARDLPAQEGRAQGWLVLAALILLSLLLFRRVLAPGALLMTTDDNVGTLVARKALLPYGFRGAWEWNWLAGLPTMLNLNWTNLLLWVLPLPVFVNSLHALDLVLASLFLAWFLRRQGLSWPAVAVAALTSFWLGSNFTLTYAGHIGKFGVLVFAALTLWLTEKLAEHRSWPWAILVGGGLGGMFLEQGDVAFFFALPWGAYLLLALCRGAPPWRNLRAAALLGLVALSAGLVSWRALVGGQRIIGEFSVAGEEEGPQAKWNYATQWSWPPEESIDFVAMGFMGWRSHEPEGPYWGRMGRTPGWEQHRQGFRNFKLENQYLGAVPLGLAIWAAVAALAMVPRQDRWKTSVLFWAAVAVATLLLAFGKYFFLYRLFYAVPFVSSIRNPNKFLQVFQLAAGVLAGYGFDLLASRTDLKESPGWSRVYPRFVKAGAACAGLFLAATLALLLGRDSFIAQRAADGWEPAAVIWQNAVQGLLHAFLMTGALAGFAWAFGRRAAAPRRGRIGAWLPATLMAADALLLARHYVTTMPRSLCETNPVVRVLQQHEPHQRSVLVVREGFYNNWLLFLFPYHRIELFNVIFSRLPSDYWRFLETLQSAPGRLWRLAAVTKLVAPAPLLAQLQRVPDYRDGWEVLYAFSVAPAPDGGVAVVNPPPGQPPDHVVVRLRQPAPRYALIGNWEEADAATALARLASRDFPIFERVLLTDAKDVALPSPGPDGPAGELTLEDRRPHRIQLRISAQRAALLRVAEKYDRYWRAWVDGHPAPVVRCDYLFLGVPVPAGLHRIELRYAPPIFPLGVQLVGMAICALAAGWIVCGGRKRGATPVSAPNP